MDSNNQSPYEQNSGTSPYGQNSGASPYEQNSGTSPYEQNSSASSYEQSSGQNPYYQQSPYQQSSYQQDSYQQQNTYQQNPYQQNGYTQNSYQQPQYQSYPTYQYSGDMEEPMSVKEWLIVDLLMMIPCVNLILVFVWAFSSGEKKSKSNYFKANLIFAGCILAFYLLLVLLGVGMGLFTAFTSW
ncbi:MAG: hypothetical protein NC543_11380 [bacterium]|nr:hypothetical protein [bacterium]MCM1374584.1 hypothetical protein [Muribaculum sp.]